MADCCTPRKKLCWCVLLFFLVAGITGGAIGIYKWHYSGLNRWHGEGSTADFQKIIQERCDTYTQTIRPGSRSRNCQAIRQAFMSAFISKDPCKATKEDYNSLINLAPPTVPCGQQVFWSKTKELAHEYAKRRHLMTLEDTLLGYLADGLRWCGEPGSSDLNIWSCPDWRKDCRTNYLSVFWEVLSERTIPWMEEPGGLQSMGSQSRTRLSDFTGTGMLRCVKPTQHCKAVILQLKILK
ncbi:ADP-ribosyl cyclase/cyclic ADP-ribose hydrolase 1 isoform X3 [Bos javanicus]|uniref:ADP-ribosyl cyclase/cyclic ADP-ribose hydrolase 1 isoform X3 n=1 Tax=Bos javanicus TaxID=9906 RepID=UPI002AA8007F|nr:ADP-ribosyl cyclase/cyclic ADP-ribose hydrolase 1 isoform X3 [Bos javanicus]